jgi:dTDP-4-amino-4,6-dideoxygalactose transaminase
MNGVPLLDLKAQYGELRDDIAAALRAVLDGQAFVLGAAVEAFEAQAAAYLGAAHAIGCASGSDALILALAGLGVGPGDEVVTSPFSFFATASCAYKVGARPVFVDIDRRTFNLDPERLDAALGPRTRAILPVHLFGQCADMRAILEIAARRGVGVVEDAAQAFGTRADDPRGSGNKVHAGCMGVAGCYSFFPAKNLGAYGDGGMLATQDPDLAARLRSLRVHGETERYHHRWVGWNSRLDALQAVVLSVKLPHLDGWCAARRANADRYDRLFESAGLVASERVQLPARSPASEHIFHQYTIRVAERDRVAAYLRERGIGYGIYYPVPLHLQECFRDLGHRAGDFPETERAAAEVLSLPIYPELPPVAQERVVQCIGDSYR